MFETFFAILNAAKSCRESKGHAQLVPIFSREPSSVKCETKNTPHGACAWMPRTSFFGQRRLCPDVCCGLTLLKTGMIDDFHIFDKDLVINAEML